MSESARPLPHRTSISSSTNTAQTQSRLTPHQIVQRITSPSSILFQHSQNPAPATLRAKEPPTRAEMDNRRNPSSFQQLEKVSSHLTPDTLVLTPHLAGRRHLCYCLQGPQPADWRPRCAERDPPRLGRRHSLHRHSRNQPHERTET